MSTETRPVPRSRGLSHEMLLYRGDRGFVTQAVPFMEEGLRAAEPVLVVVEGSKIDRLRAALGPKAASVAFADMGEVGRNPARIIPLWREFVDKHAGSARLRGIGEPIWEERSPEELGECHRHESLVNRALAEAPLELVCPYDVETLAQDVIDEARTHHPFLRDGGRRWANHQYQEGSESPFAGSLPEPSRPYAELTFGQRGLKELRTFVTEQARTADLTDAECSVVVLAVNETATNSIRHGGGQGTLRIWQETASLVCEVRDRGHLTDGLAGRRVPRGDQSSGRGLWMLNQLCDLVQIRSSPAGTVARLHFRGDAAVWGRREYARRSA